MLSHQSDVSNEANHIIHFTGEMREDSALPEMPGGSQLTVDLEMTTGLNSVGTRLWCRWLADVSGRYAEVRIQGAPMLFVKAFGQITGAITKNTVVSSLQVPYYSDSLGERKNVVVHFNEHYFKDGSYKLPEIKDSTGQEMEVDVLEDAYFAFLKKS